MYEFDAENHVTVQIDRRTITIRSIDNPRIQMIAVLTPEMMGKIAKSLEVFWSADSDASTPVN